MVFGGFSVRLSNTTMYRRGGWMQKIFLSPWIEMNFWPNLLMLCFIGFPTRQVVMWRLRRSKWVSVCLVDSGCFRCSALRDMSWGNPSARVNHRESVYRELCWKQWKCSKKKVTQWLRSLFGSSFPQQDLLLMKRSQIVVPFRSSAFYSSLKWKSSCLVKRR